MFTTSILRAEKKIFSKNIHVLSWTSNLFFKLLKNQRSNSSTCKCIEKHNYINLTLKTNANNS